jgi:hypothetical protein
MLPDTPQNGGYLLAAYIVTAVILIGYFCSLWRRAKTLVNGKKKA